MKRCPTIIFPFGCSLIILLSCSKVVQDRFPDFDPVPALNCILVAGDTVSMQLSYVEQIDSNQIHLISDAIVQLTVNGEDAGTLSYAGEGIFVSDSCAKAGSIYHCQAIIDNFPDLSACDTVPSPVAVNITAHDPFSRLDEYSTLMEKVSFTFRDDPSSIDFYEVIVRNRNDDHTYTEYAFNENSQVLLNEGLEPYTTGSLLFSDELIEDSIVNMELEFTGDYLSCYGEGPCSARIEEHTIIVELRHVSREYYKYRKDFFLYEKSRYTDFVEGVATAYPFHSNVENGYGIMAAYTLAIDSVQVAAETIYVDHE